MESGRGREGTRVQWRAGGRGRAGGAGGRGGRGRRRKAGGKFYLRVELIKCIDPNEGEALKRGREGEGAEGGGQAGGREGRVGQRGQKEILPEGGIDQMGPLPPCSTAYGGGRREGGYRLIISVSWLSTTETQAPVTSHFR